MLDLGSEPRQPGSQDHSCCVCMICSVLAYDPEHDRCPHSVRLNGRGILFPSQAHPAEDENHFKTPESCLFAIISDWPKRANFTAFKVYLNLQSYDQPRQHIKKQRHYLANKGPSSQSYGFSRSHVWMWELDHKESWVPKNWCFWTVVLEKTPESPIDCKEIQPSPS